LSGAERALRNTVGSATEDFRAKKAGESTDQSDSVEIAACAPVAHGHSAASLTAEEAAAIASSGVEEVIQ
jgi:hypothetical protein